MLTELVTNIDDTCFSNEPDMKFFLCTVRIINS